MLYYSQQDGLWADPSGTVIRLSGICLSGNNVQGQDMNQPSSQYLHSRGPLPTGVYSIGVLQYQSAVHSQGCLLTPAPGNYMGPVPRSGFFLHLRNPAHIAPDGTNASSDGCITFLDYADLFTLWANWVHKQGQSQVKVVATIADFPNYVPPVAGPVAETAAKAVTPTPPPTLPPSAASVSPDRPQKPS